MKQIKHIVDTITVVIDVIIAEERYDIIRTPLFADCETPWPSAGISICEISYSSTNCF